MSLTAIVLGSAAGGGFPQWNCRCPACKLAWAGDRWARLRTQASLAVSGNGEEWVLINASPDLLPSNAEFKKPDSRPYEHDLTRLNKKRAEKKRTPLLDHVETRLSLSRAQANRAKALGLTREQARQHIV